jgi:hypothetical protein
MRVSRVCLFVLLAVVVTGCEQPAQPPAQHAELRRIDKLADKPTPRIVGELPVRFEPITVSVVGPNNSTLGARSNWTPIENPETFQAFLLATVRKTNPESKPGKVTDFALRCSYFDESGVPTGSEQVDTHIGWAGNGQLQFTSLGVGGKVARIDVELTEVVWESDGQSTRFRVNRQ